MFFCYKCYKKSIDLCLTTTWMQLVETHSAVISPNHFPWCFLFHNGSHQIFMMGVPDTNRKCFTSFLIFRKHYFARLGCFSAIIIGIWGSLISIAYEWIDNNLGIK